jgi:hypothetical protein
MTPERSLGACVLIGLPLVVAPSGCGSGAGNGFAGEVGTYDSDAASLVLAKGDGGPSALDAQIEQNDLVVTFVTVTCSGGCADIQAVASGGHPPYHFAWDDGSTAAARQVCPSATKTYSVDVTDTATVGEVPHPAQSAKAQVTADVLDCPDASEALADGSTGSLVDAGCAAPVTVGNAPAGCTPPSGIQVDSVVTQPLVAGVATSFRVTGTGNFVGGSGWHFEVWGSPDGCALGEMLGAFQLVNGPYEFDVCATPAQSNPYVILVYRLSLSDALSLSSFTVSRCGSCTTGDR